MICGSSLNESENCFLRVAFRFLFMKRTDIFKHNKRIETTLRIPCRRKPYRLPARISEPHRFPSRREPYRFQANREPHRKVKRIFVNCKERFACIKSTGLF